MNAPTPPRHPAPRRRKLSVELYFVLYLSAIVLLLGTTPLAKKGGDDELEEAIVALSVPDFDVRARRAALVYTFVPASLRLDSSKVNPEDISRLQRDSVNQIIAYGSFADVRFDIVAIHDSTTGRQLPMEFASLVQNGRSCDFLWRPEAQKEDGVYIVTVRATATPLPRGAAMRPEIRERVARVLREHGPISDSVTFSVNVKALTSEAMIAMEVERERQRPIGSTMGIDTMMQGMTPDIPFTPQNLTGAFSMQAQEQMIRVAPGEEWNTKVYIFGVPNTMDESVRLEIPGGSARIAERYPSHVVVRGIAPAGGARTITVQGIRPGAASEPASVSFTVNTADLEDPRGLPQFFLAGQSYNLDFRVADVAASQIRVEVRENDKIKVARDSGKAGFNYLPETTGRVRFVRYIGDRPAGDFTVDIRPTPAPVVQQPKKNGDEEALITTVSYGSFKGRKNLVELKIESGNATDPEELRERANYDESTQKHTQVWRVRKATRGQPFEFSAYAIDARGSRLGKSKSVTFNGESAR